MGDFPKLARNAPYLLQRISNKQLDPKVLTPAQRRICVRFLLLEKKHAQHEIAAILMVREQVISKDKKKIQEQNKWVLDDLDEEKIATEIISTAEIASSRLFRQGKNKDAWNVQREAVDVLQTLGYLKRAPIEFKGQMSIQEILKLANEPEDESVLSERPGRGGKNLITNGTS